MIYATVDIPKEGRSVIVVIIERENLDRMKKADPITLESRRRGGLMRVPMFPMDLSMLIAYEEDDVELYKRARADDQRALLQWLERGRTWNPETDGKLNAAVLSKARP